MKIVSAFVLIIGLFLFAYSFKLDTYTNEQEYNEKYLSINDHKDSQKFFELRDKYLTPKFDLQNYGLTFIFTGFILLIVFIKNFKTPESKITIIFIGVLAALLSITGYVGELHLEMIRGSYPHWADSLGIPLMLVPVFLIMSIIWLGLNLIGIREPFKTGIQIFPLKKGHLNLWYLSVITITTLLTLVIPGFLWIYFYLSILLGKREVMQQSNETPHRQ